MATDMPAEVTIERVYVIEGVYAPDAAETRPRVRPQHLARIAQLMAEGTVIVHQAEPGDARFAQLDVATGQLLDDATEVWFVSDQHDAVGVCLFDEILQFANAETFGQTFRNLDWRFDIFARDIGSLRCARERAR